MLVVMIGIRKCLDCIFSTRELKILDDILPNSDGKSYLQDEEVGCCGKTSKLILGPKLLRNKEYTKCNQDVHDS